MVLLFGMCLTIGIWNVFKNWNYYFERWNNDLYKGKSVSYTSTSYIVIFIMLGSSELSSISCEDFYFLYHFGNECQ